MLRKINKVIYNVVREYDFSLCLTLREKEKKKEKTMRTTIVKHIKKVLEQTKPQVQLLN